MPGERVPTKLAPATWATIMGLNPLHFGQVQIPEMQKLDCDQAWVQHEWQDSDRVGRDAISEAIASAERDIEEVLGYRLLPSWEVDEWQPTVRPFRPELFNTNSRDVRGFSQIAQAKWGHAISGGVEEVSVLTGGLGVAIAWASTRSPITYKDQGTVTIATMLTEPCEIGIYYPGHNGDRRWQIRPAEVSIALGTATITFARELAVLESEIEALVPTAVDGTDDGDFLDEVDIYQRRNDPQTQATLMWEPGGGCGCGTDSCVLCAWTTQTGCLLLRGDPRLSQLVYHPGTWNAATLAFDNVTPSIAREPDIVRFSYYAGLRDKAVACATTRMDSDWERTVAYMAAARLDRPPCDCTSKHAFERWAVDLSFIDGATELSTHNLSPADLRNPFGPRRGEIYAWQRVQRPAARIGRAAVV